MGLETDSKGTFVNVKEGKLYTSKDGQKTFHDALRGTISGVKFEDDEYEGTTFEKATFSVMDGGKTYLLQLRTDSGYFRGLCNSLKSGDPTERTKFTPSYKKEADGKPQTTFFVEQNGTVLKHYSTRDNQRDLPLLEQVTFKGKTQWDGTNQISYWRNWLNSIQWKNEDIGEAQVEAEMGGKPNSTAHSKNTGKKSLEEHKANDSSSEGAFVDDLPFANMYNKVVPFMFRRNNQIKRKVADY